jgi:saccharopine dehydrogenase (NADP+, L-glutamate forming)
MKNVLVFGAGLVSKPLINYFLKTNQYQITVASNFFTNETFLKSSKNIVMVDFDVNDHEKMNKLVSEAYFVISLLPYRFHTAIAKSCINYKKNMLTASYLNDEIKALDAEAKKAGIVIMNEAGLDPGIDHMSAMKIIDDAHADGGKVKSFVSNCGGLPLWDAISTPFKYKFSWSPEGVVLAAKNSATYLEDDQIINIENKRVFHNQKRYDLGEFGEYEVYPNRDSLSYIKTYGLESEVKTMYRGTFRNIGWCQLFSAFLKIDLLRQEWVFEVKGISFKDFMIALMEKSAQIKKEFIAEISSRLEIHEQSEMIEKFEWLGLFSDEKITLEKASPFEVLCLLLKEKLQYSDGERDLVLLLHDFEIIYDDRKEYLQSLLVHKGDSYGDSAMSETVGYTAAIVAKLIIEGKFTKTGTHIPIDKSIYIPALKELEELGISFLERKTIQTVWVKS